jgi:hypothetical protein
MSHNIKLIEMTEEDFLVADDGRRWEVLQYEEHGYSNVRNDPDFVFLISQSKE